MSSQPRTCIGCRKADVRENLVRLCVRDRAVMLDMRTNMAGRGAWIHPDDSCVERANKSRAFDRAFKQRGLDFSAVCAWREKVSDGVEPTENDKESG